VALPIAHSQAATLAYEGFDYAAGSLNTQNGGFGWSSAWDANSVVTTSLAYTGVTTEGGKATGAFSSTATRALDTSPTGNFQDYIDADGNIGADNTTLWFSFLAADNATLPRVWRISDDGSLAAAIGDGGNTNSWHAGPGPAVDGSIDTGVSTTSPSPSFLVGRIDFAAGNDTLSLWVNPIVANGEPTTGATTFTGDLAFDTLAWSVGGGSVSFVDEYRFGETFADVITTNPIPEPNTAGLLFLASFGGYLFVRRRRR